MDRVRKSVDVSSESVFRRTLMNNSSYAEDRFKHITVNPPDTSLGKFYMEEPKNL